MVMNMRILLVAIWLIGASVACKRGGGGAAGGGGINVNAGPAAAREIYNQRCTTCHGASGTGDGPAGAALTPRPRSFSDQQWQALTTDDQLRRVIVQGGAAVGKSPLMPPNPDLEGRPEVVAGLVQIIRTARR